MSIEHHIDHAHQLVVAIGRGTVTNRDMLDYQQTVWSRPDVVGYRELIDMSEAEHFDRPTPEQISRVARLAVAMDAGTTPAKLAIFAPSDLAFGLGRMFQSIRAAEIGAAKHVSVFRTMLEACAFLEIEPPPSAARLLGAVRPLIRDDPPAAASNALAAQMRFPYTSPAYKSAPIPRRES